MGRPSITERHSSFLGRLVEHAGGTGVVHTQAGRSHSSNTRC